MFFIIKLILIILLNQTSAHITQDVETTILPAWKPTRKNEVRMCTIIILYSMSKCKSKIIKIFIHCHLKFTDIVNSESLWKTNSFETM